MIELVIPAVDDSPAWNALQMEQPDGAILTWAHCIGPNDYGQVFAHLWEVGDPFIICEHDIVPWPGAVEQIATCRKPWCSFKYPLNRGHLATSFGIGKYTPDGPAPDSWRETAWDRLDGQVIPHLRKLYGAPCVHSPAVAHARREVI